MQREFAGTASKSEPEAMLRKAIEDYEVKKFVALYELEKESLPEEGSYSVILDSRGNAQCITKTTRVYVVPFDKVSDIHAYKEGEGDRSLAYWRKVHKEFFAYCLQEAGLSFDETMDVVCEEFEIVYVA